MESINEFEHLLRLASCFIWKIIWCFFFNVFFFVRFTTENLTKQCKARNKETKTQQNKIKTKQFISNQNLQTKCAATSTQRQL